MKLTRYVLVLFISERNGLGGILVEPGENFFVPLDAVLRFGDPVILKRVVEEARRNATALGSGESGETLAQIDTIIFSTVDDEHGSLPVLDKGGR